MYYCHKLRYVNRWPRNQDLWFYQKDRKKATFLKVSFTYLVSSLLLHMKDKHVTSYELQELKSQVLKFYKSTGWVREEEKFGVSFDSEKDRNLKKEYKFLCWLYRKHLFGRKNELLYEKIMYSITVFHIKGGLCPIGIPQQPADK